jgi:4'-phosphopantetheinyl transferase
MNAGRADAVRTSSIEGSPSLRKWRPGTGLADLNPDEIVVWLVDLDSGLSPEDVDTAEPGPELEVLSDDERARSARFVRARDRRRFACCRAALREILGGLLRKPPAEVRLRVVEHGKPVLDFAAMRISEGDGVRAVRFNVSHSSDLALIGVCLGHEIGVDLEWIKRISEAERIVASFFSAAERAEFAGIPDHAKAQAFFRGWTRKEAVLKGLGTGLAGLSARHETGFGTADLPARFVPADPAPGVQEWQLWEAAPRTGFVATVAVCRAAADDSPEPA